MNEYATYFGALLFFLFFAADLFYFHQLGKEVDLAGIYTAGGVFLGRTAFAAGVKVTPTSAKPPEPPLPPPPPL